MPKNGHAELIQSTPLAAEVQLQAPRSLHRFTGSATSRASIRILSLSPPPSKIHLEPLTVDVYLRHLLSTGFFGHEVAVALCQEVQCHWQ